MQHNGMAPIKKDGRLFPVQTTAQVNCKLQNLLHSRLQRAENLKVK